MPSLRDPGSWYAGKWYTGKWYAGKTAVVTGAGNGFGRALALELAARGCRLALVDLDEAALESAAAEISPSGVLVTRHVVDVASEPAMRWLAAVVLEEHAGVDLLINNAGISISSPFDRIEPDAFERLIRVNFFGVVNGCREFLPLLRGRKGAQIANIASAFAWLGYPGKTAYAASKGAVRAFSECLRLECARDGIGVTVVYPGPLRTSIVRRGESDGEERREREDAFLQQHGLDPRVAARRTLDALPRNPPRIVIGSSYRLMDAAARFSPRFAEWLAARAAAKNGF